MTVAARQRERDRVQLDPLRDSRHRDARSAGELQAWLTWLELGGAAPSTLEAYERTGADLLNLHPTLAYDEFTDVHIVDLLMRYPERSRRTRKAHLASWFKWGVKTRRTPLNPIDLLPTIKRHAQPVIEVFTVAEEAALKSLPSPDGHLMCLLFEAGLRKAEAINMRTRRLDMDRGDVIVKEGAKGSKDRVVPMTPTLQKAMANMILLEGLNPDDYLWYDRPGGRIASSVRRRKPIAETSFGRWWYRCLDEAGVEYQKRDPKLGIKGRGPHTARHTFATRWRDRGLELDHLRQLMGHASISTTSDLYVHTKTVAIGRRMHELIGE